jgi:hypothetical protein
MVCGYDKVKVGQNANRGAWNTCASKAEAASSISPQPRQSPITSAPAVDRMFRKVPPRGVCAGDPAFSGARSRGAWTGYCSSGGL